MTDGGIPNLLQLLQTSSFLLNTTTSFQPRTVETPDSAMWANICMDDLHGWPNEAACKVAQSADGDELLLFFLVVQYHIKFIPSTLFTPNICLHLRLIVSFFSCCANKGVVCEAHSRI